MLDTNIWLELLLKQEKADKVSKFLKSHEPSKLFISEFSLYSIGVILNRTAQNTLWTEFVTDVFSSGVQRVVLSTAALSKLSAVIKKWKLDFDDAYQYVAAKENSYQLVSFDKDFDRTDLKRKSL